MSQHPSLRSSDKDKQHKSVLKRYERIGILKDKEKWKEKDSVFGLPKVKVVRFKIKKEKAAAAETAEAATAPGAIPAAPIAVTGKTATPSPAKGAKEKEAAKPQSPGQEGKK